jgi:hypothetical protein
LGLQIVPGPESSLPPAPRRIHRRDPPDTLTSAETKRPWNRPRGSADLTIHAPNIPPAQAAGCTPIEISVYPSMPISMSGSNISPHSNRWWARREIDRRTVER